MKRLSVICSVALCTFCFAAAGCGGGGPSAPSADEVTNFIEDNPEIMEETKRFDADPFDASTE